MRGDGVSEARLLQPADVLIRAGHDVVIDYRGPEVIWDRRWSGERPPLEANALGVNKAPEADVVVIARPGRKFWAQIIPSLQALGVRVVVDLDDRFDRIHPRSPSHAEYDPRSSPHHNWRWIAEAARLADLVTVSTPQLLEVYGNGHGRVLRNAIPARYLSLEPEERRRAIGWSGRQDTHQGDLDRTGGAVQLALDASGWTFHVVGTGKNVKPALRLSEEPSTTEGWVHYETYPSKLAELGIGIAPLADSDFNAGKSELKFMELLACGVPAVASPSPANRWFHERYGVGFLAKNPQQWFQRLTALTRSEQLRADTAGAAREALVADTYEARAEEWLDAWSFKTKRAGATLPSVKPKVFLAVITCDRPNYLSIVLDGYREHLAPLVDYFLIVHDGEPSVATKEACGGLYDRLWQTPYRQGVAAAKNVALRSFLESDAQWCFLLEDDIVPQSPRAITGYLEAALESGYDHLQFHAHGKANTFPAEVKGKVTVWPNFIGAYCLYSRRSIEEGGLFDESFVNAWEHVEHSLRLAKAGFAPYPSKPGDRRVPDATGSEEWLVEIPGSIKNSAILRLWPDIHDHQRAGLNHWKATHPDTYAMIFNDPVDA